MGTVVNLKDYTFRQRARRDDQNADNYDELCSMAVDIVRLRSAIMVATSNVLTLCRIVEAMAEDHGRYAPLK